MLGGRRGQVLSLAAVVTAALVASAWLLPAQAGTGVAVPVLVASPSGQGTVCSSAQPCSLSEAQVRARALIPAMRSDIDVTLEGGTYHLANSFDLTPADSGANGFDVVYEAMSGATPVLSGAQAITGWTRLAGAKSIWSAPIPAGFDTRQLYLNGQSLPLAQGLPPGTTFVQIPTGFLTTSTVMDTWTDPSSISVVFTGGNGAWTQTFCNVASIHGYVVTMAEPCWSNLHLKGEGVQELSWLDDPMGGFGGLSPTTRPTFLQNAYALLQPGHWSIDPTAGRIYYDAAAGQDPATATMLAPALQTLVDISGTLSNPVHNVVLRGLQFAYGGWTEPDSKDGFAEMQADWYLSGPDASNREGTCQYSDPRGTCPFASWTRTPANVVLSATHDVTLAGDTFSHLGGAGLDIDYGSQGDLVQGNQFTDISASAIQLGATDDPLPADVGAGSSEINTGNVITDNYIHDVANQYLGGVGIWVGYTQDTLISHNQIDDIPYSAISMGWGGWHANVLVPHPDPNVNAGNVISDNLLFDYMSTLGDGGAIYTNGSQATNWADALQVTGNVAYHGANTDFSIYTDAASQFVKISGNLVYDQPVDSFESGGCHTAGHILIHGNWFAPGGPAYPCGPYTDVVTMDNKTVCENPTPAQVPPSVLETAGLESAFRALVEQAPPEVTLVGPDTVATGGGRVLISGSGFGPNASVHFGTQPARAVQVLSANYILATAPPGHGGVAVTVTTPIGTSAASSTSRVTYESLVLPCLDYVGGGISTALVTG